MKYLINACVISELTKAVPDRKVVSWVTQNDEKNFYLSALTFGEIHKGICKLPPLKRKDDLHRWVEHDLKERFQKRIIDIDLRVAKTWGKIQAQSEAQGDPLPAIASAQARRAGLPAIDAEGIAQRAESERPGEILRGTETILLVDDEEMIIEVGQELLAALGYRPKRARGHRDSE